MDFHERMMREALTEATAAYDAGEVPVGAVAVLGGEIIGRGRNRIEELDNPLAHAEQEALLAARKHLQQRGETSRYLDGVTLYCTLEPCAMCTGALVQWRVASLVYGVVEPKTGCIESRAGLLEPGSLPVSIGVRSGVLAAECEALLRRFFAERREQGR